MCFFFCKMSHNYFATGLFGYLYFIDFCKFFNFSFLIILNFVCYMLKISSPNLWSFLFLFWFLEFFILLCFSRVPIFTMVEIMSHFLLKSAFLCLVQEFFTYLRWCPVFSLIICKVCLSYLSLVYMVLILFICTTRSIFIFFVRG